MSVELAAVAVSGILMLGSAIITAMIKKETPIKQENGYKKLCDERHARIDGDIKEIKELIEKIFNKIDNIQDRKR